MDIPAVLKSQIIAEFSPIYAKDSEFYYGLLYTVYNLPNSVLPLIGGILTDRYNDRTMTIVFTLFIALGQIVTSFGVLIKSFGVMILGRLIFGIGGESLASVCMTKMFIKWFQGGEISTAQGFFLSFLRLASILNAWVTPVLAADGGLYAGFYFGFQLCILSCLSGFALYYIDLFYCPNDQQQKRPNNINASNDQMERSLNKSLLLEENALTLSQIISGARKLKRLFWLLCVSTVLLYICVLSINVFIGGIIIEQWLPKESSLMQNQETAGKIISLPFMLSTVLFPVLGNYVDKCGKRATLFLVSGSIVVVAYAIMNFVYPIYPMLMLGLGYAIYGATVWPTVGYLVPQKYLGVALGIITSMQNIGLGMAPIFVIKVKAFFGTNSSVIWFFFAISILTLLSLCILFNEDSNRQISLDSADQKALIKQIQMEEEQDEILKHILQDDSIDQLIQEQNESNDKT